MKDWHGDKTELKEGLKEGEKQTNKQKKVGRWRVWPTLRKKTGSLLSMNVLGDMRLHGVLCSGQYVQAVATKMCAEVAVGWQSQARSFGTAV